MTVFLVALLGSLFFCWQLLGWGRRFGWLDIPNARSSHTVPKVRVGGIGFLLAFYLTLFLLCYQRVPLPWRFLGFGLSLAALGLADDCFRLSARWRFLFHALVALAVVLNGVVFHMIVWPWGTSQLPLLLGMGLTFFWIGGMINIYNFMDGSDGLAAGSGIIFATFLYLLTPVSLQPYRLLLLTMAASLLGFMVFNWQPSKMFMGDVGSTFLGFLFGAYVLLVLRYVPELLIPMIILLSPFLWDSISTFVIRVWQAKPFWQPHREHIYQRFIRAGYAHRTVALIYYGWALAAGALALLYAQSQPVIQIVSAALSIGMAVLFLIISRSK